MNRITCVVDNTTREEYAFRTEHGVAFWIETIHGKVLFDTGQSANVLTLNMNQIGIKVEEIDALAISHAHFDHTGGLEAILSKRSGIPIYANKDIFRSRFSLNDGKYEANGFELNREIYEERADWRLSNEPVEIFPNLWTTGKIINRNQLEGRSAAHHIRVDGKFIPDPYNDDMSLVLNVNDELVLICGCCHAGILNTLAHVQRNFKDPITAIFGGIHLMSADKPLLKQVIDVLERDYPSSRYYLNHCTGDDALEELGSVFGDKVQHFKTGESITF